MALNETHLYLDFDVTAKPQELIRELNSEEAGDVNLKPNTYLNDVKQHQGKLFATNEETRKETFYIL